jgi:hypothetical protein
LSDSDDNESSDQKEEKYKYKDAPLNDKIKEVKY